MMNRYQLAQAMTDINRIRPQVQMPPPAAPQVMSQQQRMVPTQAPAVGNPMSNPYTNMLMQQAFRGKPRVATQSVGSTSTDYGMPMMSWENPLYR